MITECVVNKNNYAKLKNTGCWKPYDPFKNANGELNCLHNCNPCNMKNAPCLNACCEPGLGCCAPSRRRR